MAQVALQVVLVAEVARVMPIVVVVLVLGALPNMDPLVLCDQDRDGTSYGTWHSMAGWDGSCIHKKELLLHEFQLTTTFTPKNWTTFLLDSDAKGCDWSTPKKMSTRFLRLLLSFSTSSRYHE